MTRGARLGCADLRERLDLAEPAAPPGDPAVQQHLAACSGCRAWAADMEAVRAVLREAPRLALPDEDLRAVWARTLRVARAEPAWRLRRVAPAGVSVAAGLLAAALLWGIPRSLGPPQGPPVDRALADLRLAFQIADVEMRRTSGAALQEVLPVRAEAVPSRSHRRRP